MPSDPPRSDGNQLEIHWNELTHEEPRASAEVAHADIWRRLASVTGNTSGVYPPAALERTLKFRVFNPGFIVAVIGVIVAVVGLVVFTAAAFRPNATIGSILLLCLFGLALLAWCLWGMTWANCVLVASNQVTVRRFFRQSKVAVGQLLRVEVLETVEGEARVVEVQLFTTAGPPLRTPLKASRILAGRAAVESCCFALTAALELRGFSSDQSVINNPG